MTDSDKRNRFYDHYAANFRRLTERDGLSAWYAWIDYWRTDIDDVLIAIEIWSQLDAENRYPGIGDLRRVIAWMKNMPEFCTETVQKSIEDIEPGRRSLSRLQRRSREDVKEKQDVRDQFGNRIIPDCEVCGNQGHLWAVAGQREDKKWEWASDDRGYLDAKVVEVNCENEDCKQYVNWDKCPFLEIPGMVYADDKSWRRFYRRHEFLWAGRKHGVRCREQAEEMLREVLGI